MSRTPYPLWMIFVMAFVLQGCGGGGSSTRVLEDSSTETNQSSLSTSFSANEVNNESRFNFNHANPLPQELLKSVNVGFGGRNAFPFAQQERKEPIWLNTTTLLLDTNLTQNPTVNRIHNVDVNKFSELQQYLIKSKYIAYWITKGWKESWFTPHKIQEAMDAGYVPIFIYYYFGDALDAVPRGALLEAYYQDTHRVSRFMQGLKGTKLLIMEPEFNKEEIVKNDATMRAFAKVMAQGIENIEHNVFDIYFSLCMTDKGRREANVSSASCGYEHCALGDQYTWSKTDLIYEILADKLSFLSFQQMVAQFSRNPENPGTWDNPNPKAFSEFYSGIHYLDERILNMSQHLYERFEKPVLVPYMTIATATWHDDDNSNTIQKDEIDKEGWNHMAQTVYEGLRLRHDSLQQSGLFGYLPMALFDDPRQDFGGYQYFMNNEYHLGLIQSGSEDGVDSYIHGDLEFKGTILEAVFGTI